MGEGILIDLLEDILEGFGVRIQYEAIKEDQDSIYIAGNLNLLRG
jgi:bifunctional DNase/RNase